MNLDNDKIGRVEFGYKEYTSIEQYWSGYPAQDGRVKGSLVDLSGKVCLVDKISRHIYISIDEYLDWANGTVLEGEVDRSLESLDWKVELSDDCEYQIMGKAKQLFARSLADGTLYALPDPSQMAQYRGECRCMMCMGKKVARPSFLQRLMLILAAKLFSWRFIT